MRIYNLCKLEENFLRLGFWPKLVSLFDMLRFDAGTFAVVSSTMEIIKQQIELSPSHLPTNIVDGFLGHLPDLRKHCREINLQFSIMYINQIEERIDGLKASDTPILRERALAFLDALQERMFDELSLSHFFHVPQEKIEFYEKSKDKFGPQVVDNFPSAIFDIEEAGKCLALSRGTACVFHLNRTLEIGLHALGKSLNDPGLDPKKNPTWESILRKCDDELKKPLAQRSQEWQKDDQFFSNATANLRAVKDGWRNPTMHVKIKYTEEEALDVFNAVKAFMGHLAKKLKE